MKPAAFKYVAATSLEQALALKAEHGDDAKFLAGGQSLIPTMNFRLARPAVLIDINGIEDLAGIRPSAEATRIGPLTRYRTLQRDPNFAKAFPLIAEALPHIAHPADPQSRHHRRQFFACRSGLRASRHRARLARPIPGSRRQAGAVDRGGGFFMGALTTDLQGDEMLVDIELPSTAPRTGACFMEIARRRGDFAIAGVAAITTLDERGHCTEVRLTFCGLGETPVDASSAADVVIGHVLTEEAAIEVAASVQDIIDPGGNVHATADYQRHIAGVLTERALQTAYRRAHDGH